MSQRLKRLLLWATLLVATLWPLVQLGLVARYDLNPWKLAGWGMYAAPRLRASLDVRGRGRGTSAAEPVGPVSRRVIVEADRFLQRWRWLRRLAPPDRLGRLVLEEFPDYAAVEIVVSQRTIDPRSGMVVATPYRFTYGRQPAAGGSGSLSR